MRCVEKVANFDIILGQQRSPILISFISGDRNRWGIARTKGKPK
jgi:hypothetical protein